MDLKNRQRWRLTGALFVGNAIASTAFLAALTVASLAAQELTGSMRLAGLPPALGTVGSALGAAALASWSVRWGRRTVFCLGFLIAAAGALLAVGSLRLDSLTALFGALFLLGFGRSVSQLSRFAAGDLWPAERQASAIGFVVWAATIGSVAGPLLIVPTSRAGAEILGSELAGPFAFAGAAYLLATVWFFLTLRPEPLTLAASVDDSPSDSDSEPARATRELLRLPAVRLAFVVLTVSQFVMILVMTMTPLHIRGHHHGLGLVSGVMMLHTLGMYALAPLAGYLADRLGTRPMILLGSALLAGASLLSAAADEAQASLLFVSLLLLGVGWNFSFVAASAALQEALALRDRLRIQGLADAATWMSGGVAALASGFVMTAMAFRGLSLLAMVIALLPLVILEGRALARRGARL